MDILSVRKEQKEPMSSQDKLEKVLRDIHVLISHSEAYDDDRIIVDKQEMFGLIDRLNISIYEIMEDYELTKQSRDKAEREHKKQGEQIIWDASRKAEDIYAASVMYTDEALNHIQAIMDESMEQIREVQDAMIRDMEEKKQIVRDNQLELKSQLQDLADTEKYLLLIEERNKEIEREKEKHGRRFGQPKEKSQFADVKAEIHVNKEYFKNAGIELEEEETAGDQPEDSKQPEQMDRLVVEDLSDLPDFDEKKEVEIDLSGVQWDVEGLVETEKQSAEESATRRKRHFFKR